MRNGFIQFLSCFIPNRKKRKEFRRKHALGARQKAFYEARLSGSLDDANVRARFFDAIQDDIERKNVAKIFDAKKVLSSIRRAPDYLEVDRRHNFFNILLGCPEWSLGDGRGTADKYYFSWEIRPNISNTKILIEACACKRRIIFAGDSFLRSINTFADANALPKYQKGISFTFDDLTCYFDATRPSRLEQMLNDKNLVITQAQRTRARNCIDKIAREKLTKYNHQPIFLPDIGRAGVPKVLVVDQSYGDMSILKGLGSDEVFAQMLKAAIYENPDADIIVKTHPDTMVGRGGYYTGLKQGGNIYTQTTPINPISLIDYADKVYVCSTQFGFEALMCGKQVHVFGMPFYAGWGISNDRQTCPRRTNARSLEEIFYIAYIMYSFYVNPETGKPCEIEEAMEYLLKLREEYFAERGIKMENRTV